MADYRNLDAKRQPPAPQATAQDASRAARLFPSAMGEVALDRVILNRLHDAMMSADPLAGRAEIRAALAQGIAPATLADHYIPTLSLGYGQMWCDDEMSFSGVTIAVSRLQSALRDLEQVWSAVPAASGPVSTVLLIVPKDVFHTLGAFVLKGQLRRKGISVRMLLGGTSKSITEELRRATFDAIFVSASQSEKLVSLRQVIDAVKSADPECPPTVIGGAILDVVAADVVTAETGADLATGSLEEALDYCGLRLTRHDGAPIMNRG